MTAIDLWLKTTTARTITEQNLIYLRPEDSIDHAVMTFLREQISGAPVVDSEGKCVGVLTTVDAMKDTGSEPKQGGPGAATLRSPLGRNETKVSELMTCDLVAIHEDASLEQAVRYLIDAHLHRVLVLDKNEHVTGVITTTDVLAAVLRAGGSELTAVHGAQR